MRLILLFFFVLLPETRLQANCSPWGGEHRRKTTMCVPQKSLQRELILTSEEENAALLKALEAINGEGSPCETLQEPL